MRICVGIDAAKVTHWAVAVDAGGRVVLDREVENDPDAIDALVFDLRSLGDEVVIGLDVVGSFARFLEAVLLAEGFALVHTPGIVVNRAGQGFAGGERKVFGPHIDGSRAGSEMPGIAKGKCHHPERNNHAARGAPGTMDLDGAAALPGCAPSGFAPSQIAGQIAGESVGKKRHYGADARGVAQILVGQ